jgi:hypothetical protein
MWDWGYQRQFNNIPCRSAPKGVTACQIQRSGVIPGRHFSIGLSPVACKWEEDQKRREAWPLFTYHSRAIVRVPSFWGVSLRWPEKISWQSFQFSNVHKPSEWFCFACSCLAQNLTLDRAANVEILKPWMCGEHWETLVNGHFYQHTSKCKNGRSVPCKPPATLIDIR